MPSYNAATIPLYDLQGRRKYLNRVERQAFCDNMKSLDHVDYLFCALIYWTGMRFSEAFSIKASQIDPCENKVVVESLKKRRKGIFRTIPLPRSFTNELSNFCRTKSSMDNIFHSSKRTYARRIKQVMNLASIFGPQASAKGLRHSYAINAITNGVPLPLIKRWMGHSSIQTTEIYLEIVGTEERKFAERMWHNSNI